MVNILAMQITPMHNMLIYIIAHLKSYLQTCLLHHASSQFLQTILMRKKMEESRENSHHPSLHYNEEEFEGFGLYKRGSSSFGKSFE